MRYHLTQRFYFEAAHTLEREFETAGSRRIHGHTYLAEIAIEGTPDATSGMVTDLAQLRSAIEKVRESLDHHLLNEVAGLGKPTLENLCAYLWRAFEKQLPLAEVSVRREASGDACRLRAPQ
jgi:6-pyruvoyltetrahydropterin/6-carboxytetrahydropterin synthase